MTPDLSNKIELHSFPDSDELAHALARAVAEDLRRALAARGAASLALSGGNTPKRFMQALSAQSLAWEKTAVTLVDERWVPETSERSNAALLRAHLLQNEAIAAHFLPLYRALPTPDEALAGIERDLDALPMPFDAVVLGMGDDGHTASFFPGGDRLAEALNPATAARVLPMRAPHAGEPRITLTLPPILAAQRLYLHIEGAAKQRVLEEAVAGTDAGADYPIRSVLRHATSPVRVFWCS